MLSRSIRAIRMFAHATGAVVVLSTSPLTLAQMSFVEHTSLSGVNAIHGTSTLLLTSGSVYAFMNAGGFAADFSGDGLADLFTIGGGAQPDRLWVNNGDGTFVNHAAAWGVDSKHMGIAGAVGDYDGDGWLDLYLTSFGPDGGPPMAGKHRLYRNLAGAGFDNVAATAGVTHSSPVIFDGSGACFGDYDLDGNLDLMVSGWLPNTQGNRLFRNNGDGTFSDMTGAAGLAGPVFGVRGFSPRMVDMDGDGWPELLLVADFKTSRYFRNNGDGTFTNLTVGSGTGLDDNGMGQVVADLDGDGRVDWFVTSIWLPGGSLRTPGTGNMLYANIGTHSYLETAAVAGVKDAGWAWGASAADFDHDGVIDLVATNGWITQPDFQNTPTRLWRGLGDGAFDEVAAASGLWHTEQGRGLLTMDFDGDGALDVVIFGNQQKARLFRNTIVNDGTRNWLRVRLDTSGGSRLAPNGVGCVVSTLAGSRVQSRWVEAGTNYQSQDEPVVHFGLGNATTVDAVRVRWTDGTSTVLVAVQPNQSITIASGEPCDLNGDTRIDAADLALVLLAWGPCDLTDPRDLNSDGVVDIADAALVLINWAP